MIGLVHILSVAPLSADTATPEYAVSTVPLPGDGRWDYAVVGAQPHVLYITRETHVQVFDVEQNKIINDMTWLHGVHGVALAPELNRGFITDGSSGMVAAFDLKTSIPLGNVKAGEKPDAVVFDSASRKVFAFNGNSHDATIFDPIIVPGMQPDVTTLPLDGKPEFAVTDLKGHVYVNLEDKSEIVEIDSRQKKITHRWQLEGGEEPSGLAIDIVGHHLFAGCGNQKMAVIDTTTGKTVGTAPIGDEVDACAFDSQTKLAYASCGDGTLSVIAETSPGHFDRVQTVKTRPGARTMALDPATHTIYLVAADMSPASNGGHPTPKHDTFVLVIVKPAVSTR